MEETGGLKHKESFRERLRAEYELLDAKGVDRTEVEQARIVRLARMLILWDSVNGSHEWDWITDYDV